MERFDPSITLWRCHDFETALERATDACASLGTDIGVWSFERRWGRTFYVAPIGEQVRFASHLCRVVEIDPMPLFVSLDDLAA